ncbi:UDP-3-O-acyl-N-acetylglucosamine deacetylase [Microseira wollei]|uniref:UDP-3-O-acyl-N-acetylglucosamine deacetylase n=1 Tax=Microseira wollei NIES-4236 TaxID=2530354 RepID=A0AAV3XEL3_9CYAN|nr:UDP-3-O-acyl-N-acetylglucosamine deacetylase [Microseira wollei]GET38812.1 UDP-3-O-acyl N-acetylglucosamine deacetylase [Microseira wollei NIES-4236]
MVSTIASMFELSGVGLHCGVVTKVRVLPASPGEGRYFVRVDLPGEPVIPARLEAVSQTILSTQLGQGKISVRTVEHLLAALAAMGVDNARIEIDGEELPLLDGSARMWCEAIAAAKLAEEQVGGGAFESIFSPAPLHTCSPAPLQQPIWVHQGDAFVAAIPSPELRFSYGIDFDLPAIGNQWYSWSPSCESFSEAIAPARTFGLLHQIDELRAKGLIKGGSLDNALVCGADGWINPPLRFANEPVRHKILDLVGDLSLLGSFPVAHFLAYKASHNLHIQLARRILDGNW